MPRSRRNMLFSWKKRPRRIHPKETPVVDQNTEVLPENLENNDINGEQTIDLYIKQMNNFLSLCLMI